VAATVAREGDRLDALRLICANVSNIEELFESCGNVNALALLHQLPRSSARQNAFGSPAWRTV
jgi:hypothetical protein